MTGTVSDGGASSGKHMVGAMARRAVTVPIQAFLPRQQPVQGIEEVVVRPGAHLDDDEPRRGVRDEDREQPVVRLDVPDERGAGRSEVDETAPAPRSRW